MSAIFALLGYVRTELTVKGGIGSTTAQVVPATVTTHPWLDLADDLSYVLNGVVPAGLALVLLARSPAGRGFGIGFDRTRLLLESLYGVGFFALIGIPG